MSNEKLNEFEKSMEERKEKKKKNKTSEQHELKKKYGNLQKQ